MNELSTQTCACAKGGGVLQALPPIKIFFHDFKKAPRFLDFSISFSRSFDTNNLYILHPDFQIDGVPLSYFL